MRYHIPLSRVIKYTLQDLKNALPAPVQRGLHWVKQSALALYGQFTATRLAMLKPADQRTVVDDYWNEVTVKAPTFASAAESLRFLAWRFDQYPLFREKMDLYSPHAGHVILDYGCGPGNDVVGFAEYSKAKHIIGVDISSKALGLARRRLQLHPAAAGRTSLIQIQDMAAHIPCANASIDYIHCAGVLHHTTTPEYILSEFHRVLKPGGQACIMVYNHDSIWLHLYVAYQRMLLDGAFRGMSVETAFSKTTDGPDCPIATPYPPAEFTALCQAAGFRVEYVGGYFSLYFDLWGLRTKGHRASHDTRLAPEHREFLQAITYDSAGLPCHNGQHAGLNSVYRLFKS